MSAKTGQAHGSDSSMLDRYSRKDHLGAPQQPTKRHPIPVLRAIASLACAATAARSDRHRACGVVVTTPGRRQSVVLLDSALAQRERPICRIRHTRRVRSVLALTTMASWFCRAAVTAVTGPP